MRFHFDPRKSRRLRENPRRGIGFEEAARDFCPPVLPRSAVGRVRTIPRNRMGGENVCNSLIFEIREDEEGESYHLITLWKSTREEKELYAENS